MAKFAVSGILIVEALQRFGEFPPSPVALMASCIRELSFDFKGRITCVLKTKEAIVNRLRSVQPGEGRSALSLAQSARGICLSQP